MYDLVTDCRICGAIDLVRVLDLGAQPLANHLRYPSDPPLDPVPLALMLCSSCSTAQISATVRPEELFGNYFWVTGTSVVARHYSDTFVDRVDRVLSKLDGIGNKAPKFVIEVASNDGTFLRRFLERGWKAFGVEPAGNIAETAAACGVPTLTEFFSTELADLLQREYGCADVVVARNVIPHVADVHSVIEGLATVAGDRGVVVIEAHSAEVILNELHYDSIYHEHLFYFSLETLCGLCEQHGLYPFDVFDSPISGGSVVAFFAQHRYPPSSRLDEEVRRGRGLETNSHDRWEAFADSAIEHAATLKEVIAECSRSGKVVGYGASARSSTMLNFAGITSADVVAVIDQNKLKQGRLTAGSDIPIVSPEVGIGKIGKSDTVLLLAWNFKEEIVDKLRRSGFRGSIVVPLPRTIRVL
ncbi:MAG: class I SAM-dependent methyltransferase [Candidatus Thalassarchaeaceae archaeon]|nr:class I SAM-dependent methyltransferase [Candidatus Thalassarchaeaceae archaeon]